MKKSNNTGAVIWFTGLSGSGKSTIADAVCLELRKKNIACERLDGDTMRKEHNHDLGFDPADRDSNIERATSIAKEMSMKGSIVLASFISPYRRHRDHARREIDTFVEVHVRAPLSVCESRDSKGLYKKARAGEIQNFTGISDPYEEPESPELVLHTDTQPVGASVESVLRYLQQNQYIS